MSEDPRNIQMLCPAHVPVFIPRDELPHDNPKDYIGRHVKTRFSSGDGDDERREWMWVKIDAVTYSGDVARLAGVLDNDPVVVDTVKLGDRVVVPMDEIAAVMP